MAPGRSPLFSRKCRDAEAGFGAKFRMWILGERLKNLLGARGIALREQLVGQGEQLRCAGLLAIRLAGTGVGGRRLLDSRRQRRDGADKGEHHSISAHLPRKKFRSVW